MAGFLDDDPRSWGSEPVPGAPVLGGLEVALDDSRDDLVVCAGKGTVRRSIVQRFLARGVAPDRFATVIHPAATVSPGCRIGAGSVLLAGTVLTADVVVGRHVVCMPGAVLTHDDVIADFATLCAGVVLGGSVAVEEAAYLGMGASVREGLRVGAEAVVGMGSVVLRDIPRGETWAGVPAVGLGPPAPSPDDGG